MTQNNETMPKIAMGVGLNLWVSVSLQLKRFKAAVCFVRLLLFYLYLVQINHMLCRCIHRCFSLQ